MLLYEYFRQNSLMSSADPFAVTIAVEYENPYGGYHHAKFKYLLLDATVKTFNPVTITQAPQ